MAVLTTETLASKLVEFLPDAFNEASAITASGASNVNFNTDIVKNISVGGANVVEEGGVKPESNISVNNAPLAYTKLVYHYITTDELNDSEEGKAELEAFLQKTAEGLIKSFDILVLNGTNPASGSKLSPALYDNSVNAKVGEFEIYDHEVMGITLPIYKSLGKVDRPDYLLFSNRGWAAVGLDIENNNITSNISRDSEFYYGPGIPSSRFTTVGLDGFTDKENIYNDVISYTGPFSKIVRAATEIKVRESTDATIGDVNLFTQNMKAYIVEMGVKFVNTAKVGEFGGVKNGVYEVDDGSGDEGDGSGDDIEGQSLSIEEEKSSKDNLTKAKSSSK